MKIRYLVLAIVGAMLLSLGSVACSDDDDGDVVSLDDYYAALEPLSQGYANDLDTLDQEAEAEFAEAETDDDQIEVFVNFVADQGSATDDFVGDLDDLNPPAEAAAAHEEAVVAGTELVVMYDNADTVFETAETFEDASLVLSGPGFVDAQARFAASCVALQGIAIDNSIEVDLACPG